MDSGPVGRTDSWWSLTIGGDRDRAVARLLGRFFYAEQLFERRTARLVPSFTHAGRKSQEIDESNNGSSLEAARVAVGSHATKLVVR